MSIYHFVYKTTNLINGRYYHGKHSTSKLEDGYLGSGFILKSAIEKYGKENFKREILALFESEEAAFEYEKQLVNPADPMSYNLVSGGYGFEVGHQRSDDVVAKAAAATSLANRNRVWADASRQKLSKSHSGKTLSEEHKKKIGNANKDTPLSEEHKKKIGNANRGKKRSEEARKRLSESRRRMFEERRRQSTMAESVCN